MIDSKIKIYVKFRVWKRCRNFRGGQICPPRIEHLESGFASINNRCQIILHLDRMRSMAPGAPTLKHLIIPHLAPSKRANVRFAMAIAATVTAADLTPPRGHRIWKFQWNPNCCCVVKYPPYILPNSQRCNFGTNLNTKYANADQRPSSKLIQKVLLVPFLIPIITCAVQAPFLFVKTVLLCKLIYLWMIFNAI